MAVLTYLHSRVSTVRSCSPPFSFPASSPSSPRRVASFKMDPELARIRREAYLSHKRQLDGGTNLKPGPEAKKAVDSAMWACGRCTFLNGCKRNSCEMCNYANPDRAVDLESDDDSVTFVPNPNSSSVTKRANTNQYPCYINGGVIYDPHPRSTEGGGWIWARNRTTSSSINEDVHGMTVTFNSWLDSKSKIHRDEVLQLAQQHNVTFGKWLLYLKPEYAVETWQKIRDAMYEGQLGEVAKIATTAERGSHVICIYCKDFSDRDDVSFNGFLFA